MLISQRGWRNGNAVASGSTRAIAPPSASSSTWLADQFRRHPRHVAGAPQEAGPEQLVPGREVRHLAPTLLDHPARLSQRVERGQDDELGQLVQGELELGDHAEVTAAAAQRPEQV